MAREQSREFILKYERTVRNIMRAMNCDRKTAEIAYNEIFRKGR